MPINKETTILFTLLRDALWHANESIPLILAENDCRQLLSSAEKQAVTGLIIDVLIRHQVKLPQMTVFEIIGTLEQIKNQNRVVNQGVLNLHKLMEDAGINYSVMKGQVLAAYYPDALLRQSGDIDYYCSPQDFERSLDVVKDNWGVQPEIHGSEKHADFKYNNNIYEPHYVLTSLHGKTRDEYWQKVVRNDKGSHVEIDGVEVRTMSQSLHTLFVFLHLYFHLMALGVGLRQFCDWAVMLHRCTDEDRNSIKEHLRVLGLEKVWRACGSILTGYLGLSEEELGYSISDRDRKYGDKMLSIVLYRGNMGHYNKRGGFKGWRHKIEAIGIKISHFTKFMPLAPAYSCHWLYDEFKRNVN